MKNTNPCRTIHFLVLGFLFAGLIFEARAQSKPDSGWPTYGNDPGGTRYSPASQINRANVAQLKVAWTYRTGALDQATRMIRKAAFEATPILADGKLLLSTPYNHVIALDPQSGAKVWEFDPGVDLQHNYSEVASRGVSAWRDSKAKTGQPCRLRIFLGTLDRGLSGHFRSGDLWRPGNYGLFDRGQLEGRHGARHRAGL